ncbi:cytochrome c maturation protein CcmE [Citromicrobium bathyomarinum]|jgi:cytochrome c-type biogenesis protein CcmE|uniref:cytochrome c maturation protein CcmE n=1 Tax=Citromicrobium TaxID=72173 RepID=UPI0001DD0820|nr:MULTISPECIES: cytochrome c maturation protein CcmE [Citromicrobium]MAO04081.1 cytochrome c maturation protein CcmE [Citromicrobium sp.]ALG61567.1 cytochrome C biogenesis protein CcmE [Citromicrobium sp. JL477]KPM13930.1 cytochrome C biogenesis protein CcmE [Citromicrobium sp. JL1351]KPM20982.1 cytochrome C biogenesis protein CcmE [Citromicrobium sp. JL31]KPM25149.1 cytochrome C biogenesis protein CcmE [Citromicrobium sp. RCC1885]|tara:strand:+ start:3542 stop:4024 length:483 start_codon:yes stop_codon:yes gene_type:complete
MNTQKTGLAPKHQRLILVVVALLVLVAAGMLAAWGLRSQADYFYLPEDIAKNPPEPGRAIRLGGMVQQGSIRTLSDGVTIAFRVTGREGNAIPVTYRGIVPDLFVEGSGVIANGRLATNGTFEAETLLAKHDENYTPRELEGLSDQAMHEVLEESAAGTP